MRRDCKVANFLSDSASGLVMSVRGKADARRRADTSDFDPGCEESFDLRVEPLRGFRRRESQLYS